MASDTSSEGGFSFKLNIGPDTDNNSYDVQVVPKHGHEIGPDPAPFTSD